MEAIVFALVALVGWASGDVLVAYATRGVGTMRAYFWWLVCAAVFGAFYVPFAGPIRDMPMVFLAVVLNFLGMMGTLLYFRALERGNASLVGAIGGSFLMITVGLSVLLYQEHLVPGQLVGFSLILVGVLLASLRLQDLRRKPLRKLISDPGVLPALGTMLLWGIFFCLVRTPVEQIGWFWAGYPGYFFFVVLVALRMVDRKTLHLVHQPRALLGIAGAAALAVMANFAYNIGLTKGFTSVVAPIAGSYPVLFVMLTRIFFHDRLTKSQTVGIVCSLLGIIAIAVAG